MPILDVHLAARMGEYRSQPTPSGYFRSSGKHKPRVPQVPLFESGKAQTPPRRPVLSMIYKDMIPKETQIIQWISRTESGLQRQTAIYFNQLFGPALR